MPPRKIIHVDMDAFYASVEQRDNPELRGRPVAVGRGAKRGVVAAASYEARAFGVRSAMPSITAMRQCAELVFVAPCFEIYRAVSRQIRAIFAHYTALIEPLSLDEAYLDVTQDLRGLQTASATAKEIRARILKETGLTASAGISYNKFLAKLASSQRKPNGQFVITPEMGPDFADALQQAGPVTSVGEKGDWLVMASWLVLLRSRLLLPAATAVQQAAEAEALRLRERLADLQAAQALAAWLDHRPLLGMTCLPEVSPSCSAPRSKPTTTLTSPSSFGPAWLCSMTPRVSTPPASTCRPGATCITVPNARERILRLLAETPAGALLASFLPSAPPVSEVPGKVMLRRRSAWSSTFIASLELTRSGAVELRQEASFGEIHVRAARSLLPADGWGTAIQPISEAQRSCLSVDAAAPPGSSAFEVRDRAVWGPNGGPLPWRPDGRPQSS